MIQENLNIEDYYKYHACHSGMISNYHKTNAETARLKQLEDNKATKPMDFGNLVHTMVLEPKQLNDRYCVLPDFGKLTFKANRLKKEMWLEDNSDQTAVTQDEWTQAEAMCTKVWAHPVAKDLLSRCKDVEKEIYWTDDNTGVPCKAKLDGLADDYLVDLKTAAGRSGVGGAHKKTLNRAAADYCYYISGAFYRLAAEQLDEGYRKVYSIFVEKDKPYNVAVGEIDLDYLSYGLRICREFLGVYQKAIVTDDWPDYGTGIVDITMPGWMKFEAGL